MGQRFISEAITPIGDTFDQADTPVGEPPLPMRFIWCDDEYEVERVLERRKETAAHRTHGSGEMYLRKTEQREAFLQGAMRGAGEHPGGGIAVLILTAIYFLCIVTHAIITEAWHTLRGNPRFGQKRSNRGGRSRNNRVRTIYHEV